MNLFLQNFLSGLSIGSVYAIFALGYTLVFSILGIINFAHGAIFTLGAYFTYLLMGGRFGFNGLLANFALELQLPFALAAILSGVLAGSAAVMIERWAYRPLRRQQADPLLMVVSSLGVAVALVNLLQYLVGAEPYTLPSNIYGDWPPALNFGTAQAPIVIRTVQVVILAISGLILVGLTYFIQGTKWGKAMRAVAEDPLTASLLGIDTERLIGVAFFISGFLGGIAGTLVGSSFGIAGPAFGIAFGLKGLAVIVLGGLGSIPGAVLGGLLIGVVEAFVPDAGYKDAIAFAILFIILLVRPQGLLGQKVIQKV